MYMGAAISTDAMPAIEVDATAKQMSTLYKSNPSAFYANLKTAYPAKMTPAQLRLMASKTAASTRRYNAVTTKRNAPILKTYTPAERAQWYKTHNVTPPHGRSVATRKAIPRGTKPEQLPSINIPSANVPYTPVATKEPTDWRKNIADTINTGLNTWTAYENTRASIRAAHRGSTPAVAYQVPSSTPTVIVPGSGVTNNVTPSTPVASSGYVQQSTDQPTATVQQDGSVIVDGKVASTQEGIKAWFERNKTYVFIGAGLTAVYLVTRPRRYR